MKYSPRIKIGQLMIALSLSGMIMVFFYLSESTRFTAVQDLGVPFDDKSVLLGSAENSGEIGIASLQRSGEFWYFFPGSKAMFDVETRRLKQGTVFLSGNYLSQTQKKQAPQSFFSPFMVENFRPSLGQIRIGELIVSSGQAQVLIEHDKLKNQTYIYAHDHSVELFLPGSSTPFLLPARHSIVVPQNRLKRIAGIAYTKLKKEFRLQSAKRLELKANDPQRAQNLKEALVAHQQIYQQIADYASRIFLTTHRFNPESFMGLVSGIAAYLQRYYGVGVSDDFKKNYTYRQLRASLVGSLFFWRETKYQEALQASTQFNDQQRQFAWKSFMIENPDYQTISELEARLQKIWLRPLRVENPEHPLALAWSPESEEQEQEGFYRSFHQLEYLVSLDRLSDALAYIERLSVQFDELKPAVIFTPYEITRLRRSLGHLLLQEEFLQASSAFELYSKFLAEEYRLYQNEPSDRKDISLEAAQEILHFIEFFVDKDNSSAITQALVKAYNTLDVSTIAQNLGRNIFTEKELNTIEVIQFINNRDLSQEELEQIAEQQSLLQFAREQIQTLETVQIDDEINLEEWGLVKTVKELTEELQLAGVKTEEAHVRRRERDDRVFLLFDQAEYKKEVVSGIFDVTQQYFGVLKLGSVVERSEEIQITTNLLPVILLRMLEQLELDRLEPEPFDDHEDFNDSSLGLFQRTLATRQLEAAGLEASRENVWALDPEFTVYQVQKARLENKYQLNFNFIPGENLITNVAVAFSSQAFELEGIDFTLDTLVKDLIEAIEASLES